MKLFRSVLSTIFPAFLLLSVSIAQAQNIQTPNITLSPEKGLWIKSEDESMGFKIGIRLQHQLLVHTTLSEQEAVQSSFL
ncbi:MAG: hypothetical protein ACMZ7B_04965 [Balneola sp.]